MESDIAVSESNIAESFIPSSAGDDVQNHENLDPQLNDQGGNGESVLDLDQEQSSGLEQRQKEADAIRDLERDMTDLMDIHQEINVHVHAQGESIDRIELQTEKATTRVAKGKESTKTAVEINRESKTLVWIIVGIAGGVLGVVLLIIIILVAVLTTAGS